MAFANEVNKRMSLFNSPFFGDSTLQSAIENFENRMNEFASFSQSNLFKTEWRDDAKGRTIYINPTDKELKMDIKIEDGMIQIKSVQEKNTDNMRSQSVSSQMMSIPQDCDANGAQISQLNDGVKIFFPYKEETKSISKDRIPIQPSSPDVDI